MIFIDVLRRLRFRRPQLSTLHWIGILIGAGALGYYWYYTQFVNPAPFYLYADPESAYMMSSLAVFKGHWFNTSFSLHPGTPPQFVGTLLYLLTYPFAWGQSESIVLFNLKNPEIFHTMAHGFLAIANSIVFVLIARYMIQKKPLVSLLLAMLFFAIYSLGFRNISFWSQNAWVFPFCAPLSLALLLRIRRGTSLRWWEVSILGFYAGVLTAITLYMAVWVIGTALTIGVYRFINQKQWRKALTDVVNVGFSSLLAFGLCTLPMLPFYDVFLDFVFGTFANDGRYGAGNSKQLLGGMITNFERIMISPNSLMFILSFVLIIFNLVFIWQKRPPPWLTAFGIGISFQQIVMIVLMLRQYHPNYVGSVATILPFLFATSFYMLIDYERIFVIIRLVLAVTISVGFFQALNNAMGRYDQFHAYIVRGAEVAQTALHESPNRTVLWTSGMQGPCAALLFGNYWTNNVFIEELATVCPNHGWYNIYADHSIAPALNSILPENPDELLSDALVTYTHVERTYPYLGDHTRWEYYLYSNDIVIRFNIQDNLNDQFE